MNAVASTITLTAAQALVRYLAALRTEHGEPLFGGVFAIFGHGNVAGMGEALYRHREELPTYRAHNEQAMAHSAIAFAKAHMRRRMMAVTTSIGPGATNLVTAAALAHVNRLPVLLLPGDIFVSRAPDPVLQQVEDAHDGGASANDALKAVSRYFDRIVHPAQLLSALPRAIRVLTDAAQCGPVTLALPQDVQAMAYDYPASFFEPRVVEFHAPAASAREIERAAALLRESREPMIVSGGGVLYGLATDALRDFAHKHGIPVAETQAGKGALAWGDALNVGGIGVTGSSSANELAHASDCVLAVGTRLQDFTTGSNTLFTAATLLAINANPFDALKQNAVAVEADARLALDALSQALGDWRAAPKWTTRAQRLANDWRETVAHVTNTPPPDGRLPREAEVIGAVQRSHDASPADDIVVCAAGTLPADLQKLWRTGAPGGYHVEYGYSCMGYEIAGGLGVKLARPEREVIVIVGDGSYLMMNSELATSVMLGAKLIVVLLDNRGYGCINRLQQACGGAPFNNLLDDCKQGEAGAPHIDFAMHARSMGALTEHVANVNELQDAMKRARAADRSYLISIDTDPARTTEEGGWWWEVAVPEVSDRDAVMSARASYERALKARAGNID
ncbi:3D-(3,5/4)-trihydroxycyclohexane-1,2-dione acylhydrolase (decyclizing) [Caballeronia sp. LZ062]|uniref:3D-(3,5/4)-trihydroxycyclohexane-1,2-dione acylhydrolase (decyclizing) n=1 Tax=unclassified Caballeronia TaxID=2646786 RepID=UPI00285EFC95|nr:MULTISPECIES: 3D-(3,5/4)-trihydroxycyclohexane-1,2-dione acylhydrolase (decyclizing) [unclassified Caballeronia]MDR5854931.1 3D-(3,5/4)-trihydroxycyclohexane-1,2-dione acylhydrolase (decyclizing) [Caballeronia sp. LZ050]MDR5870540.1 3D-(3,5/4)-trihydroxycyclohexane-1,2-dione acylhydrolase (decyclizing) [Caballeronia sp. LZ062]